MAAQNNKPSTCIYMRNKLDCNSMDAGESTPLHWAAFNGS